MPIFRQIVLPLLRLPLQGIIWRCPLLPAVRGPDELRRRKAVAAEAAITMLRWTILFLLEPQLRDFDRTVESINLLQSGVEVQTMNHAFACSLFPKGHREHVKVLLTFLESSMLLPVNDGRL